MKSKKKIQRNRKLKKIPAPPDRIPSEAKILNKGGWLVVQTSEPLPKDIVLKTIKFIRKERMGF